MASIFSRIVSGELPAHKVAETSDFLAFLDIRPLKPGHTLVIPKREVDYLFDLPEDLYIGLQVFAREVAIALRKAVPCKRIGSAVIGLEVPHAHVHLVPIDELSDLSFDRPKLTLSAEEMQQIAAEIRRHLA
jgi:histidine triad (HIT) family protein